MCSSTCHYIEAVVVSLTFYHCVLQIIKYLTTFKKQHASPVLNYEFLQQPLKRHPSVNEAESSMKHF